MSAEIIVPFIECPHRVNNPKVTRDLLVLSSQIVTVPIWAFNSGETGDLNVVLPAIPPEIHATTPNAKIRILWGTALADTTNSVTWFVKLYSFLWDDATYTLDPVSGDFSGANGLNSFVTDISLGAGKPNRCELAIPNAMAVANRGIIGLITRNDGSDPLTGKVGLIRALFVADKA